MCNAAAAIGLQSAGAASSVVGAIYGAKSQKESLRSSAVLADINAKQSEQQAQQALLNGQHQEQQSRQATANLKSSQRAGMAANGVELGVGSAAQVLDSTDVMGEIDANTIAANAVRNAWGYRVQGTNQTNQAIVSRSAGKAISPGMAGATSLMGAAGGVASSWYAMNKGITIPKAA